MINIENVSRSDIERFITNTLLLKPEDRERYSTLFIAQLFLGVSINTDLGKILDEVRFLEGDKPYSRTKAPGEFKHKPLKNLQHKHYVSARIPSIAKNLSVGIKHYGLPLARKMVDDAKKSGEQRYFLPEDANEIIKDAFDNSYRLLGDEGKLTGEWIIYAKHNMKNYYLCIASHNEDDNEIRSAIDQICVPEFPFLREILV